MVGRWAVVLVVVCGWSLVACHGRSTDSQAFDADGGVETDAETSTDVARFDTAPDAAPFDRAEEAASAEENFDVPGEVPAVEEVADAPNDDAPEAQPETVLDAADEGEVGQDAADAIDVAACVPDDPPDEVCDGRDNDCDGAVDEGFPDSDLDGDLDCFDLDDDGDGDPDATDCAPRKAAVHHGAAEVCNGVDDDCNGATDEDYEPLATVCGVGACQATGSTACLGGMVVDSCEPFGGEPLDVVCNDQDDDCDGVADDEYEVVATTCGVGACAAVGQTACVGGAETDSCQALAPAVDPSTGLGVDDTCNGVDDDCDGATDEDFQAAGDLMCGPCDAIAELECTGGVVTHHCPGGPWEEATCDGRDDDCDGRADEDYVPLPTACGVGACQAGGTTTCVHGVEGDSCQPLGGASVDEACNGLDDDCDGATDEEYLPVATTCGVGACQAGGQASCVGGVVLDSCLSGPPAADDATCDAIDDDCDGVADDDYVATTTTCGAGACLRPGTLSCAGGAVVDLCEPGQPAATDASCNAVDDDCNGATDDGYVARVIECGVGACQAEGTTVCEAGTERDSCTPAVGAASDTVCNGIDDDCDGATDEEHAPVATTCGVGACAADGQKTCVAGAEVDSCAPGQPAADDATCDAIDDDCSGQADEDYLPQATTCGVGACAASGETSCAAGALVDSCVPGLPAADDATCDARDDDCDGEVDDDTCVVGGVCYPDRSVNPTNRSCEICDVGVRRDQWTASADGSPCGGSATCQGGSCYCGGTLALGVPSPYEATYEFDQARAVVPADLNGDGRIDLVRAIQQQNWVSFAMNDGTGSFSLTRLSVPGGHEHVATGDLDRNGTEDVVYTNILSPRLDVLRNRGDATFDLDSSVALPMAASFVAVADLDGRLGPDLVVVHRTSGDLGVLTNRGDGTFDSAVTVDLGSAVTFVAIGDLDADGLPELVVPRKDLGTISVLSNLGGASFAAPIDYVVGAKPQRVALADLTGDGAPEIVATFSGSTTTGLGYLTNAGDGAFGQATSIVKGDSPAVAVGDVNGDGVADLVVHGGIASVRLGRGDGSFEPPIRVVLEAGNGILAIDVDGDAAIDLVAWDDESGATLSIVRNPGIFRAPTPRSDYANPRGSARRTAAAADVDADGFVDVVAVDEASRELDVLLNRGDGSLAEGLSPVPLPAEIVPNWIACADVTADGLPDVVTSGVPSVVNVNLGEGLFAEGTRLCELCYANGAVHVADLDSDGLSDVVSTEFTWGMPSWQDIKIFWNEGDARFSRWYPNWGGEDFSVAVGDVDDDGLPDLVSASYVQMRVRPNLGHRSFASAVEYDDGSALGGIIVADLDGDSKPDVATGSNYGLRVRRNQGNGVFGPWTIYDSARGAAGVVAGDLNGDTFPDLVFGEPYADCVGVRLNRGDGTFGARLTSADRLRVSNLSIADFDGDGLRDLFVADGGTGTVSVLPNTCLPAPDCDDGSPCTANDRWDPIDQACKREVANDGGACGDGGHCTAGACLEPLTVTTTGPGTVVSGIGGIDCGATCAADIEFGRQVTLYATPDAGSAFVAWAGDCSGSAPCVLAMTGPRTIVATFAPAGP